IEALLSQLDILDLPRDTNYIIILSILANNINNNDNNNENNNNNANNNNNNANNNNTPNENMEVLLSQLDILGLSRDTIYIILLAILSNNSTPKETLLSQLCTINLSIDTIHIISLAVLLYIYYLYSLRAKVLDGLC
ncbi:hypothetical protein, partial [Clostridium perfringens]|uniref:hypothetical protein n=1 Tax=Clostridium perfringens TaxID=1502 RepID=UPI002ACC3021